MPTTSTIWLEPITLATAEALLARRESLLLLAQREGDQHTIDQATYHRDHAAVQCAMLRRR